RNIFQARRLGGGGRLRARQWLGHRLAGFAIVPRRRRRLERRPACCKNEPRGQDDRRVDVTAVALHRSLRPPTLPLPYTGFFSRNLAQEMAGILDSSCIYG